MPEPYRQYEGLRTEVQIVRCEPRIAELYGRPRQGGSEVTFDLSPQGEQVLLVISERRWPDRAAMPGNAGGWHAHVDILVDRLNGPEPRRFWTNHIKVPVEYEKRFAQ